MPRPRSFLAMTFNSFDLTCEGLAILRLLLAVLNLLKTAWAIFGAVFECDSCTRCGNLGH